jgi:DNA-binding NtrC family response regulator
MYQNRRNVLAIGLSSDEFDRVAPFLARDSFEVDRFPSAVGSFEITNEVPFEILLTRFPLPDMELYDFLQGVRSGKNPNQKTSIVLLAADGKIDEAKSFVGRGANQVIGLEEADGQIQSTISNVLNVAPRKDARFMARMEIKVGDAEEMLVCQTENMSVSGMLMRTDRRYEKGTKVQFEFSLPNDHRPVVGIAEIMRHTMIGRDKISGVGVRFLSFAGDSQRRFQSYIDTM